jgi:alkylated DNA repair dioxygenase AlkB
MDLFGHTPSLPQGFSYHPGFITAEDEQTLINNILGIKLTAFRFQGFEAKRLTASFGYDYNFDSRKLNKGLPIPQFLHPLIENVTRFLSLKADEITEALLTEYPPGAVINWHRDAPPFGLIAGISLASDCIFKLRPHTEEVRKRSSVISLPVCRRSLYVMRDEARFSWQHSTAPVKSTRYSVTLRTSLVQ